MKKYKIGLIGYGGFGTFLRHWWSKMDNIEVAAIAYLDHAPENAAGCRTYDDWKNLIGDSGIDIVSIVTPPGLHAEMACAAMRAGKHVLLEKPAAITAESARQIIQVQKETGMSITVNHMIRYNPIIQQLKAMGAAGTFGKLRHATVNNYAQDESLPPGHWFWDEKQSGGILVEHGVHFFDIIHALSGEQHLEVCGFSHSRNSGQRDRVAATVKYDQGLIASYYHAFSGPGFFEQTTISLAYELARIQIQGWIPLQGEVTAMVGLSGRQALESLPGWKTLSAEELDRIPDASRPEGWGEDQQDLHSRATAASTGQMVSGTFGLSESKGEVYGASVQAILADLICNIEDSSHIMAVTLEDAVAALEIALLATR